MKCSLNVVSMAPFRHSRACVESVFFVNSAICNSPQNLLENMDVKKLSLLKELGLDSVKSKLCSDGGGERGKQGAAPGQIRSSDV